MKSPRLRSLVALLTVASVLASCGSEAAPSGSGGVSGDGVLSVVASFYPLQFVTEAVGGDRVAVRNLTPSGTEPHDIELTAEDTATIADADLVVYLGGFASAIDEAVKTAGPRSALDVASAARLALPAPGEQGAGDSQGGAHRSDPHFWLDPLRLADVADAVADRLSELDPDGRSTFEQHAATLRDRLVALDGEYASGLAHCASTDLVTSHLAFGYLSDRYGLTQVGIAGLSPEDEPSPTRLAEVTRFVAQHHVSTIYSETLVDPEIARTVADESGAAVVVLDPIEGLAPASKDGADDSLGSDYFEVMRSNLSILRAGQGCS